MSNGVDETFTRRSPYEERAIPEPPVLGREFERDLLAVCVDDVAAKATDGHECRMPHRSTSSLEELTGAQRCWKKSSSRKQSSFSVKCPLLSRYNRSGANADMPTLNGPEAAGNCRLRIVERQGAGSSITDPRSTTKFGCQ